MFMLVTLVSTGDAKVFRRDGGGRSKPSRRAGGRGLQRLSHLLLVGRYIGNRRYALACASVSLVADW